MRSITGPFGAARRWGPELDPCLAWMRKEPDSVPISLRRAPSPHNAIEGEEEINWKGTSSKLL